MMSDLPAVFGHPIAPGRRVLVCYEHRNAATAHAAGLVAATLASGGVLTVVAALAEVGPVELMSADLVIVGSWIDGSAGKVARRAGPPRRAAEARPRPWPRSRAHRRRDAGAVFCTYAVAPKGQLAEMTSTLTAAGAQALPESATPLASSGGKWDVGASRLAAFCWPQVTAQRALATL